MRWQAITISVLCILWFPMAFWWLTFTPHWSYELAVYTPFFPWGIGIAFAISQSAALVIPFAVTYFAIRLHRSIVEQNNIALLNVAYVLICLVDLSVVILLFLPRIKGAY